jgi:hypothetical protein
VLKIYKGISVPEAPAQLLAGDNLARPIQQGCKYLKRLFRQPDLDAILREFS